MAVITGGIGGRLISEPFAMTLTVLSAASVAALLTSELETTLPKTA